MNTSPASAPERGNIITRFAVFLLALATASCAGLRRPVTPALDATTWTSYDGKEMPWREWPMPAGVRAKAVIITVHGLSGASSDFWLLGERLPPQGYAVYGYELRGQGYDADVAKRGDIDSANQWTKDLLTFNKLVRARHPGLPVIWYGESLGTLITLHAATGRPGAPDALVLASPVAGMPKEISPGERLLLRTSSFVLPSYRLTLGDVAGVDESKIRVTNNSTLGVAMAQNSYHVASFSLRLLREIDNLLGDNEAAARRLRLPVLVLGSPHDVVSTPEQVQRLYEQIGSRHKELHWYPHSYHLLLHDVQHEEVVADLQRWLHQIVSPAGAEERRRSVPALIRR